MSVGSWAFPTSLLMKQLPFGLRQLQLPTRVACRNDVSAWRAAYCSLRERERVEQGEEEGREILAC